MMGMKCQRLHFICLRIRGRMTNPLPRRLISPTRQRTVQLEGGAGGAESWTQISALAGR